jgi:hypothetical protein
VSDIAEFGGWRPPPRWVWVIAGVAAAALLAGVSIARTGHHHVAAARPASRPAAASPFGGPGPQVARWPAAVGACGSRAYLPRIHLAARSPDMHLTVLVGGTALRQVAPGHAVPRPVPGLREGLVVTKLVAGPGADYAFVDPQCSGYLWVYRISAGAASRLGTTADDLLGGSHHAWAVTYTPQTVLTPLDGGRKVSLTFGADPVADAAAGLVVAYRPPPGRPDTVELVDPGSGAPLRRLAVGAPLGAAGQVMLVSLPDCGAPPAHGTCTLESVDLMTGQPTATFTLPAGRVPVSGAVFSPDGTAAAFQLARASQDRRPTRVGGVPPADVVVLHLAAGGLDVVPGLELPPGTGAGLAFDATGRWLLATVSEGARGELLAWRQGMPGPALVTSMPGPLMAPPPLLPAPSSRQ